MPHSTPRPSLLRFALFLSALCVGGLGWAQAAHAQGVPPTTAPTASSPAATPLPIASIPLAAPKGEAAVCESVAFSKDGSLVALFTDINALKLIRTSDGTIARELKTERHCVALGFSPDHSLLIAGDAVISTATGEVLKRLPEDSVLAYSFSADSHRLAIAHRDVTKATRGADPVHTYAVEVWDLSQAQTTGAWPKAALWSRASTEALSSPSLALSRRGEVLVLLENPSWDASCGGGDEWITARVFNAADGTEHTAWRKAFRTAEGDDPNPAPPDPSASPDEVLPEQNTRLIGGFIEDIFRREAGPDVVYVSTAYEALRWDLSALAEGFSAPPVALSIDTEDMMRAGVVVEGDVAFLSNAHYLGTHRLQVHEVFGQSTIEDKAAALSEGAPSESMLLLKKGHQWELWSMDKDRSLGCVPVGLGEPEAARFSARGDLLLLLHRERAYLWTTDALRARGAGGCVKP